MTNTRRRSAAARSKTVAAQVSARKQLCIVDPDPSLEALSAALKAEFDPRSAQERELVASVSQRLWRLRRASLSESAIIEAYRAEGAQTDPERLARYGRAFAAARRPSMDRVLAPFLPLLKARAESSPVKEEPYERDHSVPCDKQAYKPDLSFANAVSFLDALSGLSRYESLLTRELSDTLHQLPRNATEAKIKGDSGNSATRVTFETTLIGGEDESEFEHLQTDFVQQLQPKTQTERELVELIVVLSWRLRRIPAFEHALIEAARAEFKPPTTYKPAWAIDGPNHPLIDRFFFRDGKPATMTEAERNAKWAEISAERKEIEDAMAEMLGDEEKDILPHLWFMRGRDIQDKLGKLARYEAALERQRARCRKLLDFLQASRHDCGARQQRARVSG